MGPTTYPPNLIEYIWPCNHHAHVSVQPAPSPSILVDRGEFSLPAARPPEDLTEEERTGIPGRRKCCRCWATSSIFKPLTACEECEHPFTGCPTCVVVDSSGTREIATLQRRPVGEFDQTPEHWRCGTCEHINTFDAEAAGPINGFLAPMVADYMEDMQCRKCGGHFTEESWVMNPFWVYLGAWNGKVVAEGGPWHWSMVWHRDCAGEGHSREECYAERRNGRRRRENPCINKNFAVEAAEAEKAAAESTSASAADSTTTEKSAPAIPPIMVVDTDRHSLPPPSAGLTPFPEDHHPGFGDHDRVTMPGVPSAAAALQPDNQDNQTVGTGGFTIGDYEGTGFGSDIDEMLPVDRGLAVPGDDETDGPDLGSYYDVPSRPRSPAAPVAVAGGGNYYAPLRQDFAPGTVPPSEDGMFFSLSQTGKCIWSGLT
ncbi:uncharacterized protein C8A04DRAFT_14007 [Dichotomopilus funicola]|uniref:Uncharacterized protein n=1 Tax=Dichotomopilus funicola TaxID=1934379 RepID=A0AAN6UYS2_9PEZI|nr:hypothetical protein C8A04DRAFT_14007 [Dichotomopilus funicola]